MKILYLDCGMGAAGDMLTAALLELVPDRNLFVNKLNSIGLHDISYTAEKSVKCGITGTHMSVKINGEEESEHCSHHHNHVHVGMQQIEDVINNLYVSEKIKNDIISVYRIIADAESEVHGVPVTEIHFHEVGKKDAIADIAAVCMLIEALSPDKIIASHVNVGSGKVKCAHGILPVPAPATAHILRGIPIYGGDIDGELCTPTGAALLKYFADDYGYMPVMSIENIGYGMGRKDFSTVNCVRAIIGESLGQDETDDMIELSCNLDDMSAEDIGFAMEQLFSAGAPDIYTVPIGMKKSRPGVMLNVICSKAQRDEMIRLIFKHTTTIGVRESKLHRYVLERHIDELNTAYGLVHKKTCSGYSVVRSKYEYDDLAAIAKKIGKSIDEVRQLIESEDNNTNMQ